MPPPPCAQTSQHQSLHCPPSWMTWTHSAQLCHPASRMVARRWVERLPLHALVTHRCRLPSSRKPNLRIVQEAKLSVPSAFFLPRRALKALPRCVPTSFRLLPRRRPISAQFLIATTRINRSPPRGPSRSLVRFGFYLPTRFRALTVSPGLVLTSLC